jgi:DNA-binding FadR family transcriptional regulator
MVQNSAALQMRIPKASELIAEHLRRRIVQDDLAEGENLASEAELMAEFNVSRPTLREAYRILESEGLLTVRRGARGGAHVHKPKPVVAARYAALVLQSQGVHLKDVYDARMLLEGPVVEMVSKQPDADLSRLRDITERSGELIRAVGERAEREPSDLLDILELHHEFHNVLLELSGNRTLGLLSLMVDVILEEADVRHVSDRSADVDEFVASKRAQRTHTQIVELMEAGEIGAADNLWRSHLKDAATWVLTQTNAETVVEFFS